MGSAYSLDLFGVDDYVRIGPESPNGPDFGISETDSFTISFWVNYEFSQRGIVTVKQDLTSAGGDRSGFTVGIGSNGMVFVGIIPSITPSGGNDETNTGPYRDINTDLEVPWKPGPTLQRHMIAERTRWLFIWMAKRPPCTPVTLLIVQRMTEVMRQAG